MVKRALDAGAHGIMVPLLQTAAEAQAFVKATKFPPRGMRGFGSPFPMSAFKTEKDMGAVQYLREANDAIVTIVQIETREALENIQEIAAVDGVDVLFVGPFDLGNNIGYPIAEDGMHEELKSAIEKVRKAAEEKGKSSGIYCTSGDQGRGFADQGFNMVCSMLVKIFKCTDMCQISVSGDVMAIQIEVSRQLEAGKGSMAHSAYNLAKGAAEKVTGPYGN